MHGHRVEQRNKQNKSSLRSASTTTKILSKPIIVIEDDKEKIETSEVESVVDEDTADENKVDENTVQNSVTQAMVRRHCIS